MSSESTILKDLSRERKRMQAEDLAPKWFTTPAWQIMKEKNLAKGEKTVRDVYRRIAKAAAKHLKGYEVEWEDKFFNIMWNGWLAPSTPVLANMGTGQSCPVSCSGQTVEDSVFDFYESQKESALLSKNGFGTSGYLGNIRPRGTEIASGGKASGVLPVFKDFVQLSRDISQGSTRRGAWAGYLEIDHTDFWELATHIQANPDDANVGWIISDDFIERLKLGDEDATLRYQKSLKLKMITGKGYYFFVDKVNRQNPFMYKERGLKVNASNLCLTGDTKIKVKGDITGMIEITLDEFNATYELNSQIENWKIWSFNTSSDVGEWQNINASALTNPKAKLMKITDNETGKFIKCTPEHKIFTKNRGYVIAKDLNEDDELVIDAD